MPPAAPRHALARPLHSKNCRPRLLPKSVRAATPGCPPGSPSPPPAAHKCRPSHTSAGTFPGKEPTCTPPKAPRPCPRLLIRRDPSPPSISRLFHLFSNFFSDFVSKMTYRGNYIYRKLCSRASMVPPQLPRGSPALQHRFPNANRHTAPHRGGGGARGSDKSRVI